MIKVPGNMKKALTISRWLQNKGYKHGIDYKWWLESSANLVIVSCKSEKIETLVALKWSQFDE